LTGRGYTNTDDSRFAGNFLLTLEKLRAAGDQDLAKISAKIEKLAQTLAMILIARVSSSKASSSKTVSFGLEILLM
jgi:hypothetical protein